VDLARLEARALHVLAWSAALTQATAERLQLVRGDVMTLPALFFYLFAGLTVGAGSMVIVARNPVHAVLFLILAFFNAAGLFVLLGAEFLAMILVVVYVGAVAVLFLFVVMMLDVDFAELRAGFVKNAPLGAVVGLILLGELIMVVGFRVLEPGALALPTAPIPTAGSGVTNTEAIGRVLYTKYAYYFEGAGLILLVAMIGAIVLTLRHKEGVKRQSIAAQVARGKKTAIDVVNLPSGGAIIPAGTERRG
jgi:NADH-quinone oxidoreductase subunit J